MQRNLRRDAYIASRRVASEGHKVAVLGPACERFFCPARNRHVPRYVSAGVNMVCANHKPYSECVSSYTDCYVW